MNDAFREEKRRYRFHLRFWNEWLIYVRKPHDGLQIRSIESQVKTQLALWIFIFFKVTR